MFNMLLIKHVSYKNELVRIRRIRVLSFTCRRVRDIQVQPYAAITICTEYKHSSCNIERCFGWQLTARVYGCMCTNCDSINFVGIVNYYYQPFTDKLYRIV